MNDDEADEVAGLRAAVELLIEILVARGDLGAGHAALLDKVRRRARRPEKKPVRLGIYPDKYALAGPDIDCGARLHLCRARCCSFNVALSRQDVEERRLDWDLEEPYLLRRGPDGYCGYLDRDGGGCGVYAHRPGTCRAYDCRQDRRVWLDFEARIPAPMPEGLLPIPTG